MKLSSFLFFGSLASALPTEITARDATDSNPFANKQLFVNPGYAQKLEQTVQSFLAAGDTLNAARTRTVQGISTFVWVTTVAGLSNIDDAVTEARKVQKKTGKKQLVQLVLYDLPSRDCSAGHSAGEFQLDNNGLELYKTTFVDVFAQKVKAAKDLTFAVILEPDSLGNLVTNLNVGLCASAAPAYVEGIAYAIANLQADNVALYIDAAHGGWLGWADNLPLGKLHPPTFHNPNQRILTPQPAAAAFSKVVLAAKAINKSSKIRGFATNVSNFVSYNTTSFFKLSNFRTPNCVFLTIFSSKRTNISPSQNPYIANPRPDYTEWNPSYDESHYASSLSPFLRALSLPDNFIIDQGRSGLQNQRTSWGDWCNVKAGFGIQPTSVTNSRFVDAIVWAKPAGESDGACGETIDGESAPRAGQWWDKYAAQSVVFAEPAIVPTYV